MDIPNSTITQITIEPTHTTDSRVDRLYIEILKSDGVSVTIDARQVAIVYPYSIEDVQKQVGAQVDIWLSRGEHNNPTSYRLFRRDGMNELRFMAQRVEVHSQTTTKSEQP